MSKVYLKQLLFEISHRTVEKRHTCLSMRHLRMRTAAARMNMATMNATMISSLWKWAAVTPRDHVRPKRSVISSMM